MLYLYNHENENSCLFYLEFPHDSVVVVFLFSSLFATIQLEGVQPVVEPRILGYALQLIRVHLEGACGLIISFAMLNITCYKFTGIS